MCFSRGVCCNLSRCRFARGAPDELDISSTWREQTLQLARKGNRNSVEKPVEFLESYFPTISVQDFVRDF